MPVVLLLAAVAVVAATIVLASGRGGELREPALEPLPTGLPEDRLPTGVEAAALRLPKGLWGYHPAATDEAVNLLARALMRREEEVAELRAQIAEQAGCRADGADLPRLEKPDDDGGYDLWPFVGGGSVGFGGEERP